MANLAVNDWAQFFQHVDDAPKQAGIDKVVAALQGAGLQTPGKAVGLAADDLACLVVELPLKAFLRRTTVALNDAAAVKKRADAPTHTTHKHLSVSTKVGKPMVMEVSQAVIFYVSLCLMFAFLPAFRVVSWIACAVWNVSCTYRPAVPLRSDEEVCFLQVTAVLSLLNWGFTGYWNNYMMDFALSATTALYLSVSMDELLGMGADMSTKNCGGSKGIAKQRGHTWIVKMFRQRAEAQRSLEEARQQAALTKRVEAKRRAEEAQQREAERQLQTEEHRQQAKRVEAKQREEEAQQQENMRQLQILEGRRLQAELVEAKRREQEAQRREAEQQLHMEEHRLLAERVESKRREEAAKQPLGSSGSGISSGLDLSAFAGAAGSFGSPTELTSRWAFNCEKPSLFGSPASPSPFHGASPFGSPAVSTSRSPLKGGISSPFGSPASPSPFRGGNLSLFDPPPMPFGTSSVTSQSTSSSLFKSGTCRHINTTGSGSNQYASKLKCKDCGEVLAVAKPADSVPAPSSSIPSNRWNAHEKSMGGQGHSSSEIQAAYRSTTPPAQVSAPRSSIPSNSWNAHQKSMGGQGHSSSEIHASYTSSGSGIGGGKSVKASSGSGGGGGGGGHGMSWNDFQSSKGGKGYSKAEMQKAYHAGK